MAWHLDLIVLYDWQSADVENVEILAVETWKVASAKRSSTTRNYIGAVDAIEDLRMERGEFATIDAFYDFWRKQPVGRPARMLEPEQAP